MIHLFLFPQYLSLRVISFILTLFAFLATPAAGPARLSDIRRPLAMRKFCSASEGLALAMTI